MHLSRYDNNNMVAMKNPEIVQTNIINRNFYTLGLGDETNASITYGLTLIDTFSTNRSVVSYSNNSRDIPNIVAQYKNSAYTAETDALTNILQMK